MKGRGGSIVRNYFTLKRVVSYNNRRHYQPPENNFGNYFEEGGGGGSLGRVDGKSTINGPFSIAMLVYQRVVEFEW